MGNFTWAIPTMPFAQAHYRSMQRFYIDQAQKVDFDLLNKANGKKNLFKHFNYLNKFSIVSQVAQVAQITQIASLLLKTFAHFRNPGKYGNTNRPGFRMEMKLFGKFASQHTARSHIDEMREPIKGQPKDVYTMSMLTDIIIGTYIPGDVILIGMSHPTTFTVEKSCFVSLPFVLFFFLNPKKTPPPSSGQI